MHYEHLRASARPFHVLIIGGGIGGLCLAQGLKKAGISVAVYERDNSAHFRNQGYRISLTSDGSQALRDCLPESLFKLCVATAIKTATRLVLLDHQLNQKFGKSLEHSAIPDGLGFGVNRLTLREILLAGLEGMVHFGKACERLEQLEKGQVQAYFTDGSVANGNLLVGADGTQSVIRRLIAPEAIIDTLHWAIYGKTPIRPDILEWVPAILIDSFNRIVGPQGTNMSIATCQTLQSASEAVAQFAPTVQLTEVPDYFSWTLSLSAAIENPDGSKLHQQARSLVKEWHPALRRLIDEADIPATFPVWITSARPVKQWSTPHVTLLGDAIHTMSPSRGEGANVALRDAALLRQALEAVATGGVSLAQAKAEYEQELLRYGFAAVSASLNRPYFVNPSQTPS